MDIYAGSYFRWSITITNKAKIRYLQKKTLIQHHHNVFFCQVLRRFFWGNGCMVVRVTYTRIFTTYHHLIQPDVFILLLQLYCFTQTISEWVWAGVVVDMIIWPGYTSTFSSFRVNQTLLVFLNAACLVKKQQIQILIFGLTGPRLWLKIYNTQGNHTMFERGAQLKFEANL